MSAKKTAAVAGGLAAAVRPPASSVFANSLNKTSALSPFVWTALRLIALAVWLAVAWTLYDAPELGLRLLWGLIVPALPLALVFAPGLWRQVCPLAFANQAPRRIGLSLGLTLPARMQRRAFSIAFFAFFLVVSWRAPYFNHAGPATAALLLAALAAATLGGVLFKGRSGWCGTFCPLGPVQRVYGHAPVVRVDQTYCEVCVGCQKNCYDFSPQAAVFDDMYDENPGYAGERRLFYAMLPGLLCGYFLIPYSPAVGYGAYAAMLVGAALASVGVYQFATSFLPLTPYRAAAVSAAAALGLFYAFCGPLLLETLFALAGAGAPPQTATTASRLVGGFSAVALLVGGLGNEARYRRAWRRARDAAAAGMRRVHWVRIEGRDELLRAEHNQALLSLLTSADCGVEGQCGASQCGSDAVEVIDGLANLTPPGAEERATLARLALGPGARLACGARVLGPVALRLRADPAAQAKTTTRLIAGGARIARPADARRMAVIGNGVGGETVAELLSEAGARVTLIARESAPFYDRTALGRIVEGLAPPTALAMRPEGWHAERGIDLRLGVGVEAIDRDRRRLTLSDGRALRYDQLVLATGARPRLPAPNFLGADNAFVLHGLDDAMRLRAFLDARRPARAAVIGGGALALETAESLARIGLRVTLIHRAAHPMRGEIDAECAAILTRYLERLGVAIRAGARIDGWRGGSRLSAVRLDDREIAADLFVACIGVEPNVDLARAAGLATRRGVLVDETMRTSDPGIYAIGDVAERAERASGLWATALAGARTAAASILGEPFDHMPAFAPIKLKSPGIDLRAFGLIDPAAGDETIVAPPFQPAWWRIVRREGVVIGACHAGPPGSASALWSLVSRAVLSEDEADRLREGEIDEAFAA